MVVEDALNGSSPECEARYRAAISCAGLLFLDLAFAGGREWRRLCMRERERDMDQVLSSSSSSCPPPAASTMPCSGSVLKTTP